MGESQGRGLCKKAEVTINWEIHQGVGSTETQNPRMELADSVQVLAGSRAQETGVALRLGW